MINKILSLFSFIAGFFISKKASQSELLKQQIKQYEVEKKEQEAIINRNIAVDNISNPKLFIKQARTRKNKL
jgi:hypothetical protein